MKELTLKPRFYKNQCRVIIPKIYSDFYDLQPYEYIQYSINECYYAIARITKLGSKQLGFTIDSRLTEQVDIEEVKLYLERKNG